MALEEMKYAIGAVVFDPCLIPIQSGLLTLRFRQQRQFVNLPLRIRNDSLEQIDKVSGQTCYGEGIEELRVVLKRTNQFLPCIDEVESQIKFRSPGINLRSEEHTSELQSLAYL